MSRALETIPDGIVVALDGKLDSANAAATLALISAACGPETKRVVFDCSELAFISSAGLGVLVQAARLARANGGSVHHFGAKPAILQIFRIAGLGVLLTPYQPDPAAATVAGAG